ncbi:phenylacetate--CoA ligase family protein [Zoogloea sp.]|uniref:phenylacetate--CoA ligase family protein n=1 Tax=Zoogloea sp. TaxID=49181 RepID=UPI002620A9A1|nr:phenylacetate--CoA ligase family protein [Zoogloea sp.]MDD3352544.1 phenylacetate--CoA ligase family protein [Zoogloea sp.]
MSDLYGRFVSRVLFPLQERLKKHATVRVRREMEASQWWSRERIEDFQAERLKAFLMDVSRHSPYYRQVFQDRGFNPASLTSIADLQKLPFLTKALIKAHSDSLRADNAVGLSRFNTGGSSGEPLIFFIGTERVTHDVAAKWRATRWWDVDIGDREVVIWGSPIELGTQDRVRLIRDTLMRTRLLPAFEMSDLKVEGFIDTIIRMRPAMLFGYPSAISHIAGYAERKGIRLDNLGVKVVFVTSERLYDHQRELISRLFACPVANGYGGRDAGFIAHQCPSGSMHVTAEDIVVEIIDSEGRVLPAGEAGEIVVTHMATRDYPFVRYRTGDVGVLGRQACACGRGLPVLSEIQGRSTDFLIAADGTVMHGLALIYVLRDIAGVASFKIVQESLGLTTVYVVPGPAFLAEDVDRIQAGLKRRLGEQVVIDVRLVDMLPAEASGKFRYVVSRVTAGGVVKG